jgi:hypothetical protein
MQNGIEETRLVPVIYEYYTTMRLTNHSSSFIIKWPAMQWSCNMHDSAVYFNLNYLNGNQYYIVMVWNLNHKFQPFFVSTKKTKYIIHQKGHSYSYYIGKDWPSWCIFNFFCRNWIFSPNPSAAFKKFFKIVI